MFDGAITVRDGRKLGYAQYGPRNGYPVVLFHGTPGSRFQTFAHLASRDSHDVRIIVPERPGYGLSDVQHVRTLFDHAADIQCLVADLGIHRFSVVGISGGAPYALACVKSMPEQIERAAIVCGVGPFSETSLLRASADRALIDKELLGVYRDMFVEAMRIPDGIVDDYAVLAQPWNFSPEDIHLPLHVWHSTDDETVGFSHAHYIVGLNQGAVLHQVSKVGHLGTPLACIADVMAYVTGNV